MFRALCLGALLVIPATVCRGVDRDDVVNGLGWIRTPLATGRATGRDLVARQAFLKTIDENQAEEFRKEYLVEVADRPTNLPRDYDVLVYGRFLAHVRRLEIQVRGDRATAELVCWPHQGIRRGEVPAERVDWLARQLIYSALSTQRTRPSDDGGATEPSGISSRYATHMPRERIEVISRDPDRSFHLRTDASQPLYDRIEKLDSGVPAYAHTVVCKTLFRMAYDRLPLETPDVQMGWEVTKRLRLLRSDRELGADGESSRREEVGLAEIDRLAYGQLAVKCRAKAAVPELERLGLRAEAAQLRLTTAEDSSDLLRNALESSGWTEYAFALQFAQDSLTSRTIDVLLDSLPRLKDEFRVAAVLKALDRAKVSAAQIQRVRDFYQATKGERSRVAAARFLLFAVDDEAAFQELKPLAMTPLKADGSDVYAIGNEALNALLDYSYHTGKRRTEIAVLIRALLDRLPATAHSTYSRKDSLIAHLGKSGDKSDIPRLKGYVHDDEYLASIAIDAIAAFEAPEALALARRQIERYLGNAAGGGSFRWNVMPYLDLIVRHFDHSAAALVEAAAAKSARESPRDASRESSETATVKYLRARTADERAQFAVEYLRLRGGRAPWMAEVGRRLIAEGADPRWCQPLLDAAREK